MEGCSEGDRANERGGRLGGVYKEEGEGGGGGGGGGDAIGSLTLSLTA